MLEAEVKGDCPLTSWKRIVPREKISVLTPSTIFFSFTSGARYFLDPYLNVGKDIPSYPRTGADNPKSDILILALSSRRMFSSLRSLWVIPFL